MLSFNSVMIHLVAIDACSLYYNDYVDTEQTHSHGHRLGSNDPWMANHSLAVTSFPMAARFTLNQPYVKQYLPFFDVSAF